MIDPKYRPKKRRDDVEPVKGSQPKGLFVRLDIGLREKLILLHGGYEAKMEEGKKQPVRVKRANGRRHGGCIYAVFLCMALHTGESERCDEPDSCFLKLSTISKETGYAESTVQGAIDTLEELGLVGVYNLSMPGSDPDHPAATSNLYSLHGWAAFGNEPETWGGWLHKLKASKDLARDFRKFLLFLDPDLIDRLPHRDETYADLNRQLDGRDIDEVAAWWWEKYRGVG